MDAKVGLTDYDRESINLLTDNNIPFIIVANKVDKLSMSERHTQIKKIQEDCSDHPVIIYSSKTLEGKDELVRLIMEK